MSQPNNTQLKWIALSALFLLILGGGAYKFSKRSGETSPTQGTTPSVAVIPPSGTLPSQQPNGVLAPLPGNPSSASNVTAGNSGSASPTNHPASPSGVGITATLPSVPGAPNVGGANTQAPVAAAPVAATPAAPTSQCMTMTYRHKTLASHGDEESCSHHKNVLKLQGTEINAKSICVRVNGTPVHYLSVKGHADEVIFGSVAGPKAKVTVRYCTGKGSECAKFAEECVVPKDEFMEAIGGAAGDSKDARLGQWDPSNPSEKDSDVMARLDGEVKKELETNDDLNGRAPAGEMFKDWIGDASTSPCGTKQASN